MNSMPKIPVMIVVVAALLRWAFPCRAELPENHDRDNQAAQLLRRLNVGGPDAVAARQSLDEFMRSDEDAVYHILTSSDHDLAKVALAYIGNRSPRVESWVRNPLAGAGPFLIEIVRTSPDSKSRDNALQLLIWGTANFQSVVGFLSDDRVEARNKDQVISFLGSHRADDPERSPDNRAAVQAAIPALLSIWDQKLSKPLNRPEEEEARVKEQQNDIAQVFGTMRPTPVVLKALPLISVKYQLAVSLMGSFVSESDVPDSVLFSIVGYASTSPVGFGRS